MNFSLEKSFDVLERTPAVLDTMLQGISADWTSVNEGDGTWSVYDVIGHLIHGEKTDWIPRAELILSDKPDKTFAPFDRFAQFDESPGKSLAQLLDEFKALRQQNMAWLRSKNPGGNDFEKTGIHPAFGSVTLSQLLATWAVHDLNHIAQIVRVMAYQYKSAVGPWIEYLRILKT
ncbi:DinB family protein [Spirosoma sp. KNUC1025]|uniref:DinB family protein n=1 Tax=Spirosoma sp. KNUC1025 TaxID=2894082 RepID=UPI0038698C7F|nr:DinB family protein [Spirosoma sp. KNUC1025]